MTPAQQPKEYIITEWHLKQLQEYVALEYICQAIRSRPHPAPATIIGKQTHEAFEDAKFPVFVQGTGWISKIDAERMFAETAARKARSAFAQELLHYRKQHSAVYGDIATYHDEEAYLKESLREQQAGDP